MSAKDILRQIGMIRLIQWKWRGGPLYKWPKPKGKKDGRIVGK